MAPHPAAIRNIVPGMRRLLTPVGAGIDAGLDAVRHLLWYLEHHTRGPGPR